MVACHWPRMGYKGRPIGCCILVSNCFECIGGQVRPTDVRAGKHGHGQEMIWENGSFEISSNKGWRRRGPLLGDNSWSESGCQVRSGVGHWDSAVGHKIFLFKLFQLSCEARAIQARVEEQKCFYSMQLAGTNWHTHAAPPLESSCPTYWWILRSM